jgi:hypothetical protein
MRHHAKDVAAFVQDPGDVAEGAVGIGGASDLALGRRVAEGHAVLAFQALQRIFVAEVIAFHVANGNFDHVSLGHPVCEGCIRRLGAQVHLLADVLQPLVSQQGAGQQAGFAQYLKAVADAKNQAPLRGKLFHRLHYGREACNGASAQVVAVGKPAGDNDCIAILQVFAVVPEKGYGLVRYLRDHVVGVVVAVGTWENKHAEFHTYRLAVSRRISMRFCASGGKNPFENRSVIPEARYAILYLCEDERRWRLILRRPE